MERTTFQYLTLLHHKRSDYPKQLYVHFIKIDRIRHKFEIMFNPYWTFPYRACHKGRMFFEGDDYITCKEVILKRIKALSMEVFNDGKYVEH